MSDGELVHAFPNMGHDENLSQTVTLVGKGYRAKSFCCLRL